jgi:phosphohistidine phosphatase SixA
VQQQVALLLLSMPVMLLRYEKQRFMVEAKTGVTTAKRGERQNTRRLWLVRHGLTEWNAQQRFCGHSDIPLSARGRVQAHWLVRQLQDEAIATVCTSDLVRVRETAEIIASQSTQVVQLRVSAGWREIDFGAWEGLTYAEIAEQCKDQLDSLPIRSSVHRRVASPWHKCCSEYMLS